jgi:NADH:ubiquinone oxidoreductase subunit 3 (subunit A)
MAIFFGVCAGAGDAGSAAGALLAGAFDAGAFASVPHAVKERTIAKTKMNARYFFIVILLFFYFYEYKAKP